MCCKELREGKQPGGDQACSAECQSNERSRSLSKRLSHQPVEQKQLPFWKIHKERGPIPCPPKERGGCGYPRLCLKRTGVTDISSLSENVEKAVGEKLPEPIPMGLCSLCFGNRNCDSFQKNMRLSAHRENSMDNYLFCPSGPDLNTDSLEHFQKHWLRGEPVIVRDVFENTKGLSWGPMVMWRALRETCKNKVVEETKSVRALDCLDWCEVCKPKFYIFSTRANARHIFFTIFMFALL